MCLNGNLSELGGLSELSVPKLTDLYCIHLYSGALIDSMAFIFCIKIHANI